MINTNEEIYVKGIVENYYKNDYKNYICITNNPNTTYNQSYYDIYCYFSKNEIEKNDNTYNISNGIKCDIDTKTVTSTYKQNSLNCSAYNGTITADKKEFIYSNINGESNLIGEYTLLNDLKIGAITISIILLIILLYRLLKNIMK